MYIQAILAPTVADATPDQLDRAHRAVMEQAAEQGHTLGDAERREVGRAKPEKAPCRGRKDGQVEIRVEDNGPGIPGEIRARIFEPFFTTKPVGVGTGLGLSTVYGIVKQARGYIWADSDPGMGTTFMVYLPRCGRAADVLVPHPAASGNGDGGTETVLVAEDEEVVLELARKVLERKGYRVLAAARGQEAVRIAREYPSDIHVLFCDAVMPDLTGGEVVERVREEEVRAVQQLQQVGHPQCGHTGTPSVSGQRIEQNIVQHAVFIVTDGGTNDTPRRCTQIPQNQRLANGIQIFPGSVPVYRGNVLVGGVGVSGDGIDQDDMISFLGAHNAGVRVGGIGNAPAAIRADQLLVGPTNSRLRYVGCPFAPFLDSNEQNVCQGK